MSAAPAYFILQGTVQTYAWGGFSFLPQLLQVDADGKPWAEYWLGIHPAAPARLEGDVLLQERAPDLPFLLKVLDVRQMLSIQVHPSKEEAEKGFDREEAAGIPRSAPHRNYKDRNHKPEMMVALSPFYLLHGFRPEANLRTVIESTPELTDLLPVFDATGYEGLYRRVSVMEEGEASERLNRLRARIEPLYEQGTLKKEDPHFWAARAFQTYCAGGRLDRGIFSIYLFNLVYLQPGEGIYQGAGMPHAYLEGQNIELMATSDNVLRGGLTDKHVDVEELMKQTKFEATHPRVLRPPSEDGHRYFRVPAPEFELHEHFWKEEKRAEIRAQSDEVWIFTRGMVKSEKGQLDSGSALYVPAGAAVPFTARAGTQLFRAAVPAGGQEADRSFS